VVNAVLSTAGATPAAHTVEPGASRPSELALAAALHPLPSRPRHRKTQPPRRKSPPHQQSHPHQLARSAQTERAEGPRATLAQAETAVLSTDIVARRWRTVGRGARARLDGVARWLSMEMTLWHRKWSKLDIIL
jgi:hypothetical protein